MTSSIKDGKKAIIFGKKYLIEKLSFIDNQNTYLKMLYFIQTNMELEGQSTIFALI